MEIPGLELIEQIGVGGMSEVYKAWDFEMQRLVAVKILSREFSQSGKDVSQFREEALLMKEIQHPGIVEAYTLDKIDGKWLMVMEYVDGYTFAQLLRRKQHVSEADCLLIIQSVAAALHYVWNDHKIVHCDIKPENIMINSEGVVKLTDLGIAERFQTKGDAPDQRETPDHIVGTPSYISPEQVYGDVQLDWRTDVYSLGASIYHLATGRVLFPGLDAEGSIRAHCDLGSVAKDPRVYHPELSDGFVRLLERMLVKDRNYRTDSWLDLFRLARLVEEGGIPPERVGESPSSLLLAGA